MRIEQQFFRSRPKRNGTIKALLGFAGAALLVGSVAASPLTGATQAHSAGLRPEIQAIMDGDAYQHATWGLLEVDPATGQEVHAMDPDTFFIPGSTAKLFSVSATWATLGPDHRFTTPVYSLGDVSGGTLTGNLVLVASGDLDLGGRTTPDGRWTTSATSTIPMQTRRHPTPRY